MQHAPWFIFWQRLRNDKLAMLGGWILLCLVLLALLGKVFTEWYPLFDPATVRLVDKFQSPFSHAHPQLDASNSPFLGIYLLGTDELGCDVFARMLQGAFVSLSIGFIAVGISTFVGILLGGLAGFYGQYRLLGFISIDKLIMRFTDVMLCFPTFFLILTVVALLPPSIYNIMIVIGLSSWMGTARFVRAEFLSLREREFVKAATAMGLPDRWVIFVHMLPNAMAPVLVTAIISVANAILIESALSFLGFGVQPPDATWGNILADGKGFIFDAPWLFFIPGISILLVVLAFNLLGEGMRDALDTNSSLHKR
jgi:peptide/nickel transport system permease protein